MHLPDILLTDDDDKPDNAPTKDYLMVFKSKLRELLIMLADVYPPMESYRINQKVTAMGRVPLFVSIMSNKLIYVWVVRLIQLDLT